MEALSTSEMQAVGRRVIVRVWEAEQVTRGGIVLPQIAQEQPQVGEVVSVGESVRANLKRGDVIVFAKYAGTEMDLPDGQRLLVLDEDDVQVRMHRVGEPIVDRLLEVS